MEDRDRQAEAKVAFERVVESVGGSVGEMTVGTLMSAIFVALTMESIAETEEERAALFYEGYVQWQMEQEPEAGREEAERIVRSNIGWCFGEGRMTDEEKRIWHEVVGASHPIFGTATPTPEEALKAGIERGRRAREQSERGE